MEQKTRIRINLSTREVEWEGSETFLAKYDSIIEEYLDKIKENSVKTKFPVRQEFQQEVSTNIKEYNAVLPESFGEYYTSFSRNIKVVDKILIAAYFVQEHNNDRLFTIKEASDLLNEQNVLVTNANAFIKSLLKTGKLFKNSGKYKVSEKGVDMVNQLKTQS